MESYAERRHAGRELRIKVPRLNHAGWAPPAGRPDPPDLLEENNRPPLADLVPGRPRVSAGGSSPALPASTAPDVLVGRSADCGALDDLVEAVQGGLSRSLVIVGEPGIGKTRLLRCTVVTPPGKGPRS